MSSEDTGVDEAQVQSLLKKHKDVTDELKNYANVIQQLKQQVRLSRLVARGGRVTTEREMQLRDVCRPAS